MRTPSTLALTFVILLAGVVPVRAQYTASDTLKAVVPGLVYREYSRVISSGDTWRVTDPDATFSGEPDNSPSTFLPNPVLDLTVSDLQGAVRAVAVIDVWGGHVGTVGKQFRLNGNGWIDIPDIRNTPGDPECYTHQYSVEVEVPLEDLVEGVNSLEGLSDGQTCYNFGWGQWGWYGFILRVIYDPALKDAPAGSITSPLSGAAIGENAVFAVDASGGAGIARIDVVGRYDDFDVDGNGVFADWQQSYHRLRGDGAMTLRRHIGTASIPPYEVVWDNAWIPDQASGAVEVVARIKDAAGLWSVTDRVTGLTLERPGISVKLYPPTNVPERFWVRAGQTKSSQFVIPAGDDLAVAESARLHAATWNGINGHKEPGEDHWTRVNAWTTPEFGVNHHYSFDLVVVPVGELQAGTNTVTFHSESSHHGNEILWPGPGLIVRYADFSAVPATILTQPEDRYALEGGTATFGVVAVGADPLTYQWQRDGVDIPGADGPEYTTPPVFAADDGALFRCAVSNGLGGDVSDDAVLTVLAAGDRTEAGQIVRYDFDEGAGATVADVSGVGIPLDLAIADPGAVTWLPGALSIDAATVVASAGAATKVVDAVTASGELTIEAWIRPANLAQNGPARIVTLSPTASARNFTLGQGVYGGASDVLEVRLRSTTTDPNGQPALATPEGTLTTALTHVVFTRDASGVTRIYVDAGEQAAGQTAGDFSNWDPGHPLGLANEFTGDRPWLGELHLVALFDRALSPLEVLQNYAAGPEAVASGAIDVTVETAQGLSGPVTLHATPDGRGDPLGAAQAWSGVAGEAPTAVDATIVVQLLDGTGQPVVGFPAGKITVAAQSGGWTSCPASPLVADGPTDGTGTTTISGTLFAGGASAPGELLQVVVDDPGVDTVRYPGGLAGLEIFVNGVDLNGDHDVNLADVADFAALYASGSHDFAADFIRDGLVNLSDVVKLGQGIGSRCPPLEGAVDAATAAATPSAEGALAVVFDRAGVVSARGAEPGEKIEAYVVLTGTVADEGIEGFDVRVRTSDNVVVHQEDVLGTGLPVPVADGWLVGFAEPRRATSAGLLRLVRLVVSVTDTEPAVFHVESASGPRAPCPRSRVTEGRSSFAPPRATSPRPSPASTTRPSPWAMGWGRAGPWSWGSRPIRSIP